MSVKKVVAIDLGASSGRVILGVSKNSNITLKEIHRFDNKLIEKNKYQCWDLDALYNNIKYGIELLIEQNIHPDSIGIDTWGVDFVLLDKDGNTLGDFVSYRDQRTLGVMDNFLNSTMTKNALYAKTGIQFLPFNTLYQLIALQQEKPDWLDKVARLLFIPDYLNYRLTGIQNCEYTNASTSQMLNCMNKDWSATVLKKANIPTHWLLKPKLPNHVIGYYLSEKNYSIPVVSVASHDTASAVVGAPLQNENTAFLSSGTWSLMGIERKQPIINDVSTELEVTHEGGAEGRYRILKNIMGLWLVQCLQREYSHLTFPKMVEMAQQVSPFRSIINPDDQRFLNPKSMEDEIKNYCHETQQPIPNTVGELTRCIYDSLALTYRFVFNNLKQISEVELNSIHIIGGGANNLFLNQLCANVCQLPISANPTEASSLGNIIGQLIALKEIDNVEQGRQMIRQSFTIDHYQPEEIDNLEHAISLFSQLIKLTK